MLYQVKHAEGEGEATIMRYGIFVNPEYSDDYNDPKAQEALKAGFVLVDDAILPELRWVAKANLIEIPAGTYPNEYDKFVEAEFEKAQQASDALTVDMAVGRLFSRPVGDGAAWYVVTKVNKRTVYIELRHYNGDRWVDGILGYGGKFDRDLIDPLVRQTVGLSEIFGRSSVAKATP